jgi:glutamyl-tRNA synthetase
LPQAFINFVSLRGWAPKDNREVFSRQELIDSFSIEGIHHSNAMVNFTEEDPFDPKGVWLNTEHIKQLPLDELTTRLLPYVPGAAPIKMRQIAPLIRERIRLLRDAAQATDFFFLDELPAYDPAELIPQKGDAVMARFALGSAGEILAGADFTHAGLDAALRAGAVALKIKPGQMFQPIRVAVCGRKEAPPLFETLEVLGRETCLKRIGRALEMLPA